MSGGVIVYGDTHGSRTPPLGACEEECPEGVVIVGDCDLAPPLRQQVRSIFFAAGIRVRWIPGNHDTDIVEWPDCLRCDYPGGNLPAPGDRSGSRSRRSTRGTACRPNARRRTPPETACVRRHAIGIQFTARLRISRKWATAVSQSAVGFPSTRTRRTSSFPLEW